MATFSLMVLIATLALVTAHPKKHKTPPVTIMPSGSSMAETTLAYFSGSDYREVALEKVASKLTGEDIYRYQQEYEEPIKSVYLIPPHHIQIDGSESDYVEGKDFKISCTSNSVTLESKHLGFYHMRVVVKKKLGRGRRAIEQSINTILNAGMLDTCGGLCQGGSCSQNSCNNRTKVLFECPPYNECSFIAQDATLNLLELVEIWNANIVANCTEFVAGVCKKYEQNGNQSLDILFQAHGANGIFCFGPPQQPIDCIFKGSPCYQSICENLRGKIKSLTIYACSVAGGDIGAELIQCLADCLDAEVKAYKKDLYLGGSTGGTSLLWATVDGFQEPCVAIPTPPSP